MGINKIVVLWHFRRLGKILSISRFISIASPKYFLKIISACFMASILSGCMGESALELQGPEKGFTGESLHFNAEVTRGIKSKGTIQYEWNLLSKPENSTTELPDDADTSLDFVCDEKGQYQLSVEATFEESGDTLQDDTYLICERKPELLDYSFAQSRGRAGHGGTFPIDGNPIAGNGQLIATTIGDVETLGVDVKTGWNTTHYDMQSRSDVPREKKWWFTELEIPESDFTLTLTMNTPQGQQIATESKKKNSMDFAIKLTKSDHYFYPSGDNLIYVEIINQGEDRRFTLSASDSEGYLGDFEPMEKLVATGSNEYFEIHVPIPFEADPLTLSPADTEVKISVAESQYPLIENIATTVVRTMDAPNNLHEGQQEMVILTDDCATFDMDKNEVEVVLLGTKFVDVNKIQLDRLWFEGAIDADNYTRYHDKIWVQKKHISPSSTRIADVRSLGDNCHETQLDNIDDLILTVPVSELIGNGEEKSITITLFYGLELWNTRTTNYFSRSTMRLP